MVNSCSARLVSLVLLSRPLPTVLRRSLRSGVHSPVDLFNSRAYTAPYMNLEHLRAPSSSAVEGKTIGPYEMEPEWSDFQLEAIERACSMKLDHLIMPDFHRPEEISHKA